MTREQYLEIVASLPLDKNGCRVWTGARADRRYPGFEIDGATHRGNRVVLEAKLGRSLLPGYWALHTCDVSMCVHEDHLYEGTQADNERDMVVRKRKMQGDKHWSRTNPEKRATGDRNGSRTIPQNRPRGNRHGAHTHPEKWARGDQHYSAISPEKVLRGEDCPAAKLTEVDVKYIRENFAKGDLGKYADRFGVSKYAVYAVVTHRSWKHVK